MKLMGLKISDSSVARSVASQLAKVKKVASEAIIESENFSIGEPEQVEIKMQFGKVILSCNEFILTIGSDVRKDWKELLCKEIDYWSSFLGPERVESPMIMANSGLDEFVICSDKNLAELLLRKMELMLLEIERVVQVANDSNATSSEKKRIREMAGYFVSFHAAIQVCILIDHPDLIPDSHWRSMVEHAKSQRPTK